MVAIRSASMPQPCALQAQVLDIRVTNILVLPTICVSKAGKLFPFQVVAVVADQWLLHRRLLPRHLLLLPKSRRPHLFVLLGLALDTLPKPILVWSISYASLAPKDFLSLVAVVVAGLLQLQPSL